MSQSFCVVDDLPDPDTKNIWTRPDWNMLLNDDEQMSPDEIRPLLRQFP
jgi:hypothetical protein